MKKRVAVLGAGPTGLAAAWKLAHQDFEVDLFEKDRFVGGLGGSVELKRDHRTYIVDYGPHIFHVKRGEVYPLLRSIYDHEITIVPRKTRMIIGNKSFTYPFKFNELVTGLPITLSIRILISYIVQLFRNKFSPRPIKSFEDWGIERFGRVLYELCFGNYTAKVWGIPTAEISPALGQQKVVNKLSLLSFIKNMMGWNKDKEQFTHYQDFVYCLKGSGHFFEELGKSVENMGASVLRQTRIKRINMDNNNAIKSITFDRNGKEETREYDYVLSSIPISVFVNMMTPSAPKEVVSLANSLKYRSLILVYLVVKRDYATNAHWTYLLDKRFVFNRITEQKQFSRFGMEDDTTVVCFEICYTPGDKLSKASDEELYKMTLEDVDRLNGIFFRRDEVIDYFIVKRDHVYPLFDIGFENRVKDMLDYLQKIPNLITTGRNGLFVNNDMHSNMIHGIENAQKIINQLNQNTPVAAK